MRGEIKELYGQMMKQGTGNGRAGERGLRHLADACGRGDAAAMLELSEYLRRAMPTYGKGANMWLLRAAIYGNAPAQRRVRGEIRQNPHFLEESTIPYENFLPGKRASWHSGAYPGYLLNELGLLSFEPGERYLLAGISEQRTFFQPLPGVPMLHSVSSRDIRYLVEPKKKYEAMTQAMQRAAAKRRKPPLWMEFV